MGSCCCREEGEQVEVFYSPYRIFTMRDIAAADEIRCDLFGLVALINRVIEEVEDTIRGGVISSQDEEERFIYGIGRLRTWLDRDAVINRLDIGIMNKVEDITIGAIVRLDMLEEMTDVE